MVERRFVAPEAAGSIPVLLPEFYTHFLYGSQSVNLVKSVKMAVLVRVNEGIRL